MVPGALGAREARALVLELRGLRVGWWPCPLQGSRAGGVVTERGGWVCRSRTSSRGGWDQPTSASPGHFSCSLAVGLAHLLGISLLTLGVGGCHLVEDGRAGGLERLLSLSTLGVGGGGREVILGCECVRASVHWYPLEAHAVPPNFRMPKTAPWSQICADRHLFRPKPGQGTAYGRLRCDSQEVGGTSLAWSCECRGEGERGQGIGPARRCPLETVSELGLGPRREPGEGEKDASDWLGVSRRHTQCAVSTQTHGGTEAPRQQLLRLSPSVVAILGLAPQCSIQHPCASHFCPALSTCSENASVSLLCLDPRPLLSWGSGVHSWALCMVPPGDMNPSLVCFVALKACHLHDWIYDKGMLPNFSEPQSKGN